MKNFLATTLALMAINAQAGVNATSLKINVYQVAVSLNENCSSPQVIFTSTAGTEKDFLANPTLGNGSLANGTYNCVMITMDDVIKFTPSANTGATGKCVAGTEYAVDLCRAGGSALENYTDLLVGTTTTNTQCAGTHQSVSPLALGGVANKVTLYLRTTAPANNNPDAQYVTAWQKGTVLEDSNAPGQPSVDSANGIQLTAPFVVSGTSTGTFFLDATGKVQEASSNANCEIDAPVFGFR